VLNIQKIQIDELKPAEYNPRLDLQPSDKEYQKIKRSIEEFGYVDPVIVNKDLTVIGGHQRIKALKDLGYTDIDCVVIDIDKTREKALNVALNKISGNWELTKLKDLLEELDNGEFDIEITGFDMEEIENLMVRPYVDLEDFAQDETNEQKQSVCCPKCGFKFEV